jgi:flagellar M-ring protein FliF
MNEFIKKYLGRIAGGWKKWTLVQRIIFAAVIISAIGGFGFLAAFSSSPSMTPLLYRAIPDQTEMARITQRLDQEGIPYQLTADSRVLVSDEKTAQRMRAVLAREDLIPAGSDPWQIFDVERWTITDFERNVNLRRAITRELVQHITALEDVDAASADIVIPEDKLFVEQQDPVTASIIITPKPGSDLTENRKKLEGIEKLVRYAIPGLKAENITITDNRGIPLNDFAGFADMDRLALTQRELKIVRDLELQYKNSILSALQDIYGKNRVRIINLNIDVDTSKKTIQDEKHSPIIVTPDNPRTPYDESAEEGAKVLSITISKDISDERFKGTGIIPQGPPGVEGQVPPAYKDLENQFGEYSKSEIKQNEVVNTTVTNEEKTPWETKRVTAAVAIDGIWKWRRDEKGDVMLNVSGGIEREYVPVADEELAKAAALVRDAVGYSRDRGDSVTVQHIVFDRTTQHDQEDRDFRSRQQMQRVILSVIIAIGVLLISFITFRLISRELERRRRAREDAAALAAQQAREAALLGAEQEGVEIEMSVEERARLEMQENAINLAREHPGDVAQLLRTWMMEE